VKLFRRRKNRPVDVRGTARIDRRTKDLIRRLAPGDIAIIDHPDIDRVAADTLVSAGVAAVVNASPSMSGRYPNGGPIRIVNAGIPLLDGAGPGIMDQIREGDLIEVRDGALWRDGEKLAVGELLAADEIEMRMEDARRTIGVELQKFARNTLEYIESEALITFEPLELPPLRAKIRGRHVLVVVRGHDYEHDLKSLRPYIREYQPVMIAVDGGADALLALKLHPDVIIGDFDSLSDTAMHCGAQLIHHVHPDGRAPGRENLLAAGVEYDEFVAEGMSEDAALLIAYEAGATLIVAVGTHATMVEFLDKGRRGMASTFLTRLRLGPALVDAKGVSRLYEGRIRRRDMVFLVASAIAAMAIMIYASHSLHVIINGFRLVFRDSWDRIASWF
jgi:uncharacterized membrane-anchored protein